MHVGRIVGVLQPFALPEVALRGVIVALSGGELLEALDVVVDVAVEVVVGLFPAGGFIGGARVTANWNLEVSVGVGEAEAAGKEDGNEGGLHGDVRG